MQDYFDTLFGQLKSGHIDRQTYVQKIDEARCLINKISLPQLDRRCDSRTLGEFALQIFDNTEREAFLMREWLKATGREDVQIVDHGVSNDGRLLIEPGPGQGRPDYELVSDKGRWKLEVKFCPTYRKLTFKVVDLRGYIRQNADMLLIMGDTRMIGANGNKHRGGLLKLPPCLKWCVIIPRQMQAMLDEFPVDNYREMGGKPSVQIIDQDYIRNMLKVQNWNYTQTNR